MRIATQGETAGLLSNFTGGRGIRPFWCWGAKETGARAAIPRRAGYELLTREKKVNCKEGARNVKLHRTMSGRAIATVARHAHQAIEKR